MHKLTLLKVHKLNFKDDLKRGCTVHILRRNVTSIGRINFKILKEVPVPINFKTKLQFRNFA